MKKGVIEEALVETIGCSGMTHSAAMAGEILPGKTILLSLIHISGHPELNLGPLRQLAAKRGGGEEGSPATG